MMTPRDYELKCRALLDLPECGCGEGVACPEIVLNMFGHPNEVAVAKILNRRENK